MCVLRRARCRGDGLPGLAGPGIETRYNTDLTQAPHWAAYHDEAFVSDDLVMEYAAYSETPLQNLLYWTGTSVVDVVQFSKVLAIGIFGLTAAQVLEDAAAARPPVANLLRSALLRPGIRSTGW